MNLHPSLPSSQMNCTFDLVNLAKNGTYLNLNMFWRMQPSLNNKSVVLTMFIKRPFPCLRKLLPAFDDHKKYIIGCFYVDLIYVLKYASLCAAYKKLLNY